ncbi:MAG: hypothetical protein IPO07_25420 [Haliscomenobacter sp.]|nr:alpha-2-macroglobulin family protein [Haliscomenobacter sp.]MBK9491762.1 hypothetical protein [Haliscomenobacter sp.]
MVNRWTPFLVTPESAAVFTTTLSGKPRLGSNRYGEAQFKVKFPDDITNWKTFVIAADKNRQAGLYTGNIQSYKPLMAQLNLPRFLVHGIVSPSTARCSIIRVIASPLRTYFQAADQRIYEKQNQVKEGLVEKSEYQAPSRGDSLQFGVPSKPPRATPTANSAKFRFCPSAP